VLEHVLNIMKKFDNVKINTVFNEFVADDKRANKNIVTKRYELFHSTDLQEWYELHVVKPILASLEEFQERDSEPCILNLTV